MSQQLIPIGRCNLFIRYDDERCASKSIKGANKGGRPRLFSLIQSVPWEDWNLEPGCNLQPGDDALPVSYLTRKAIGIC